MTHRLIRRLLPATGIATVLALPLSAQRAVSPDDWQGYNRTFAGDRFSPLSDITTGNVARLRPVCTFETGEQVRTFTAAGKQVTSVRWEAGLPVSGSRTWIWQMAAPALAAPMQALAISSGVTGRLGLCARVGNVPVTAQVRMVGFIECLRPPLSSRHLLPGSK